jgi:hypothetical protein
MNIFIEIFQVILPELFLLNDLFAAKRDISYYDGFILFFASFGLGAGMFLYPFVIYSSLTGDVAGAIAIATAVSVLSFYYRNLACRRLASARYMNIATALFCSAASLWAWQSGTLDAVLRPKYGAFLVFYVLILVWVVWRAKIFNKTRWYWLSEPHTPIKTLKKK